MDYHNGRADKMRVDEEKSDAIIQTLKDKAIKILFTNCDNKALRDAIIINYDSRGYCLKISDKYMIKHNVNLYRDFGGYGIIAPDFNN